MRPSSLALLLLAGCAAAAKTPVTEERLQKLTRYAAFSSAAYSRLGCLQPPYGAKVAQFFDNSTSGTQAYLFRDDAAQELILAIRGTSSIGDFIVDYEQDLVTCDAPGISCASSNNCTCYEGYLNGWKAIEPAVVASLDAELGSNSGYNLTITGHSLGGGEASIGAVSLRGLGYDLVAYSYGQPRTGDPKYADYVDQVFGGQNGTFYRATHTYDGVPQIPSTDDGYRHHSTEYWQSADPAAAATTYECEGQEPEDCNLSTVGIGIGNDGIGINLAHLSYFDISIGNPVEPEAACDGSIN